MKPTTEVSRADKLRAWVRQGESATLEFKRSTGELKEGLQTLCAFLNGSGGTELFGIRPEGTVEGQSVSDKTIREISQALDRFEPPVNVSVQRMPVGNGKEVLAISAEGASDSVPFTFEGRPYERVGSTTRRMSRERYEQLLLERAHARRRWENQPAVGVTLKDLDREEILRTREMAIQQGRISAGTSRQLEDILDRLGLRQDGVLTQAAQVLYGTRFLPDYPQCMLKMGRFRGTDVTGEIVDNRQEHLHAFAMVREGMAFLERTLPIGARFPKGSIFREDRLAVPREALREILLNAVMHRDYSDPGGYVAIAIFDDRVEIRSYGRLPAGITPAMLARTHLSKPRNLLIAEAFHRTGAVEIWGRGTNRVIDACRAHGIPAPTFEEKQGFLVVTFRAETAAVRTAPSRDEVTGQVGGQVTGQVAGQVLEFCRTARKASEIQELLGLRHRETFINNYLRPLLESGWIERTIPDKPRSRLQRYRTTAAGMKILGSEAKQ
jgi:ATP-dependent DNA helicase RecG